MSDAWIDWSALQEAIPDDERQSFHQEFAQLAAPADDTDIPYTNEMTESIDAALKQLEREGRVRYEDGRVLVARDLVPESYRKYL